MITGGIGIVYLLAIGIVVAVLLLAPKYPSVYYKNHEINKDQRLSILTSYETPNTVQLVGIDQGIPELGEPYPYQTHSLFHPSSYQDNKIPSHTSKYAIVLLIFLNNLVCFSFSEHFIPSPRDEVILFDINPRRMPQLQQLTNTDLFEKENSLPTLTTDTFI